MSKIPTIEKERFEAWLNIQARDRTFQYNKRDGCLAFLFLKENTSMQKPAVSDCAYYESREAHDALPTKEPLPVWLMDLLRPVQQRESYMPVHSLNESQWPKTTFGEMQDRWKELWPESHSEVETPIKAS